MRNQILQDVACLDGLSPFVCLEEEDEELCDIARPSGSDSLGIFEPQENFLGQDEHYFGSLSPDIRPRWLGSPLPAARNLTVQTLLGLDSKQVSHGERSISSE